MDKKDILILESISGLLGDMYFKELKGSELVEKVILQQNFARLINNLKNPPKVEPVKDEKCLKENKSSGKRKK